MGVVPLPPLPREKAELGRELGREDASLRESRCAGSYRDDLVRVEVRGWLVFKAHIVLYHSTLGSRVLKKKKIEG